MAPPTKAALLVLGCACGRIGFDAPALDAADPDATPVAPCHVPTDPFGPPMRVPGINDPTLEDDDPTLPADQLELYFASARAGGSGLADIWLATRPTTADPWSTPVNVLELSSVEDDVNPEISVDGLTMHLSRGAPSFHDIYLSTRPDRITPWTPPVRVAELSSADNDDGAALAPDMLSIVLSSTRAGGTLRRGKLFIATRDNPTDPWSTPIVALEDPDPAIEESQASLGDTAIYFHTIGGPGGQDLHCATRTGPTSFGPLTPLDELNTTGGNTDAWLSPDLRIIYFTRDDEIHTATR